MAKKKTTWLSFAGYFFGAAAASFLLFLFKVTALDPFEAFAPHFLSASGLSARLWIWFGLTSVQVFLISTALLMLLGYCTDGFLRRWRNQYTRTD